MTETAVSKSRQSRLTGALALMMAQAVVLVLGYATHLWIGRVLGPASYGIFGVVLSLQTIFGLILALGVPVAVARYSAQHEQGANSILRLGLKVQVIVGLVVAGSLLLASPVLATILGDEKLQPYIMFIALVVLSQGFYPLFTQFLSGIHRFNRQAQLTVLYASVKLIGAIVLIYFFQIYGAFAGFMVGGIVAALVGWFWTRNEGGKRDKVLDISVLLKFASVYVLTLVGLQILISIDLFMVKALLKDDIQAGYYNAAVTLSRISYMLLQSLGFVLLPSVAMLMRPGQSHKKAVGFIKETIRYLIAVIVPGVVLAATTSKALIKLFYSDTYLPAAPVLSVLMVGLGALAFYLLLTNIVAGAGKPKVALYFTVLLIGVSFVLGSVLIPMWGLVGAAWQTTITGLLGLALMSRYTFREFNIPVPWRSAINVGIATAAAVAPIYWWQATPVTMFLHYGIFTAIYLGVLMALGEITDLDRGRLAIIHPSLEWVRRRV